MARFMCGDKTSFNTFVAVDFGTTYSGFCFAVGESSDEYLVQPSAGGEKIPTALLLYPDKTLHSFGEKVLANYKDLSEEEAKDYYLFDRFKMKLQTDKNVRGDMPIKARNNGKTLPARFVFSRSLEYFCKKAKEDISNSTKLSCIDSEIKWILTVPAIWGEKAREFMRKAAEEAGMVPPGVEDNIVIALEPEGAALCCRQLLGTCWRSLNKPGKLRYIVVDCGGGTIDVTINDLDVEKQDIKEVHRATGDAWGGTYVDEHIEKFFRDLIGESVACQVDDEDWLTFTRVTIENAKRSVTDSCSAVYFDIPSELFSAIKAKGGNLERAAANHAGVTFRNGRLKVDVSLMKEFFKDSLDNISRHVKKLMSDVLGIQCMLVVGGYADSPFLMQRMEADFAGQCRVIRPKPQASTAIVKGAVMYGQDPNVISTRVARFTYGVKISRDFEEGKDPESKKYMADGKAMCNHIFDKFLEINTPVDIGNPINKTYIPMYADQKAVTFAIYRSSQRNVTYTDEPGCENLVTVTINSPNVEKGLNRTLKASMDFSRTLLKFKAIDVESGNEKQVKADFHSV